jgi:hypothetical protein
MDDSPLMLALKQFEATEANLIKLENLWTELSSLVPGGIQFGGNVEYDDRRRAFENILGALPKIDGWKPSDIPMDLDDIAQWRMDAKDSGEITAEFTVEREIEAPGRAIHEYRFKFNEKRRALIRDALIKNIDEIDADIRRARKNAKELPRNETISGFDYWKSLRNHVDEIDALLGSSVQRPPGWTNLCRHLHFGIVGDLDDIEKSDWPSVKKGIRQGLYGANEPIPIETEDLSLLVKAKPTGIVSTRLRWTTIDAEGFERLIFTLISAESDYENPEWLMKTNAPDRGRDLSVTRINTDSLSGASRSRVIIQCRHRVDASISVSDIATLKEQMALWGDPRVNILVIATTGRFSADAVAAIEKHNTSDSGLTIKMWPESHLERLLASRPALIAQFDLR